MANEIVNLRKHTKPSPAPRDYIKIARRLEAHEVVGFGRAGVPADPKRGAYSYAEAWLTLLFQAQWKENDGENAKKFGTVERGELVAGRKYLADKWNWTEKAVRCFLDSLEEDGMIERRGQQKGQQTEGEAGQQSDQQNEAIKTKADNVKGRRYANVLTIRNYNKFQGAIEQWIEDHNRPEVIGMDEFRARREPANGPANRQQPWPAKGPESKKGNLLPLTTIESNNQHRELNSSRKISAHPYRVQSGAASAAPLENLVYQDGFTIDAETGDILAGAVARRELQRILGNAKNIDEILREIKPRIPDQAAGEELVMAIIAACVEIARERRRVRSEETKADRGKRFDQSMFEPSWGDWAMREHNVSREWVREQAIQFRDYWLGRSGQAAYKVDWLATWRGWINRAHKPGSAAAAEKFNIGKLSKDDRSLLETYIRAIKAKSASIADASRPDLWRMAEETLRPKTSDAPQTKLALEGRI